MKEVPATTFGLGRQSTDRLDESMDVTAWMDIWAEISRMCRRFRSLYTRRLDEWMEVPATTFRLLDESTEVTAVTFRLDNSMREILFPCDLNLKSQRLPDELISQILLRCPLNMVYRCKCLSNEWNRYLSSSSFRLAYVSLREEPVSDSRPPPLLGFFHYAKEDPDQLCPAIGVGEPERFSFLPTNLEGEPSFGLEFLHNINAGHFRGTSNGLVLCGDYPHFHVFNPTTRQSFSLPRANLNYKNTLTIDRWSDLEYWAATPGFVSSQYDNDFRVVVPFYMPGSTLYGLDTTLVDIYSSKIGRWEQSQFVAVAGFKVCAAILSNFFDGVFFWFTTQGYILAYNPERDYKCVQLIRLPYVGGTFQAPSLCQSQDGFLQCTGDDCDLPGFRVYILAKKLSSYGYDEVVDSKEWVWTYTMNLASLNADWRSPLERRMNPCHDRYVVRGGFHPMNPRLLYFRLGTRIFSCDVKEGSLTLIPYGGHLYSGSERFLVWPYVKLAWPPSPLPLALPEWTPPPFPSALPIWSPSPSPSALPICPFLEHLVLNPLRDV